MADIYQSFKTKIELVMVSCAFIGMLATAAYVYRGQTAMLETHQTKLAVLESESARDREKNASLESVMNASVIPAVNANKIALGKHESRIENMEKNSRQDREILIEIRNDLKWMRARQEPGKE